jgi:EAL domain-containing protein (putative c-di-GMP-specific phosphodiesterase class I)
VRFSIDDFGTGYSSLSYLKRFRVDNLKIDQSFVRHMLSERGDAAIVLAVISLAHRLGLKVIAEGVETAEHCAFLRQHGCDEMQGYYFSKPVPAEDFARLLASGKRLAA